jgi:Methyltransferase domain
MSWAEDQEWERQWWGGCTNTLSEEWKQLAYFKRLGLQPLEGAKTHYTFDVGWKMVLDIGGGPSSFLLRCVNVKGFVIDPCRYPAWVAARYAEADIAYVHSKAEDFISGFFDEVWMYNVLQHVEDPEKVVRNARASGKLLRLFDWIDAPIQNPGHPHQLTEAQLNRWLGATGTVEDMNENGAIGKCYYGVFPQ